MTSIEVDLQNSAQCLFAVGIRTNAWYVYVADNLSFAAAKKIAKRLVPHYRGSFVSIGGNTLQWLRDSMHKAYDSENRKRQVIGARIKEAMEEKEYGRAISLVQRMRITKSSKKPKK